DHTHRTGQAGLSRCRARRSGRLGRAFQPRTRVAPAARPGRRRRRPHAAERGTCRDHDARQHAGVAMKLLPLLWHKRRMAMLVAAAGLLLLALLLPDVHMKRAVPQVIVVLDVTQSMNTVDCRLDRDAAPASRLACVKDALADGLRELPCGSQVA